MENIKHFIADVTLCTGTKVKAIVQAKNLFHASKLLGNVYGASNVGVVSEHPIQQEFVINNDLRVNR